MSYMGTFTSESMLGVQMGTWIFKSMFGFQNGYMAFQIDVWFFQNGIWLSKSMLDFPHGSMICQVDVGFPKWEHGFPNRCWMSIHTLGSNNGFKHWVQTWCDAQVWNDIDLLNDAFPLCPPAFPPVHPFSFQSRAPYSLLATALLALYITQLLNIYHIHFIYDDAVTNHIHCLNAIL